MQVIVAESPKKIAVQKNMQYNGDSIPMLPCSVDAPNFVYESFPPALQSLATACKTCSAAQDIINLRLDDR
jgi:hypothetical protein